MAGGVNIMTTELARSIPSDTILEQVVLGGDLSKLSAVERLQYYRAICDSLGLNPLTRPFEYLHLNGKLVLYARRDATDQLRRLHQISITIISREQVGDVYCVIARATDRHGRMDESLGAVPTATLKGEFLANMLMKSETKAKRRVTLSICGLGMLDETEVESIDGAETSEPSSPPSLEAPATPPPVQPPLRKVFIAWREALSSVPNAQELQARWKRCTAPEVWSQLTSDEQTVLIDLKDLAKRQFGIE
jgi:hypothetical protein